MMSKLLLGLLLLLPLAGTTQESLPAESDPNSGSLPSEAPTVFDADSFFGSPRGNSLNDRSSGPGTGVVGEEAGTSSTGFPMLYRPALPEQQAGLTFTGEASTDLIYAISEPFNDSGRAGSYSGISSLRLDAVGGNRNSAKMEASVSVRMMYGDAADKAREVLVDALSTDFETSAGMIAALLLGASGPLLTVDLQKLYLSVYMPRATISIGRMMVNYGRGTVFSPVDLFSGVDTNDLALGRTGNDALRVLLPFGDFSGLDLVSTIAESPERSLAGGRLFGHILDWDFGLAVFRDGYNSTSGDYDLVLGLDLKGDIELGVSAETVVRLPFDAGVPDPTEAVYSLMAGLDYSIKGKWFFDLEYLWNLRAGQTYPVGGFRHGHNIFASLSWKPDDLTALDVRAIVIPVKGLGQASLGVSRSVANGANLMGFATIRNGNVENRPVHPGAGFDPEAATLSFGARLSVVY